MIKAYMPMTPYWLLMMSYAMGCMSACMLAVADSGGCHGARLTLAPMYNSM